MNSDILLSEDKTELCLDEAGRMLRERAAEFGALAVCGARDPGLPILARRLVKGGYDR